MQKTTAEIRTHVLEGSIVRISPIIAAGVLD
jgi:hypothetical protein